MLFLSFTKIIADPEIFPRVVAIFYSVLKLTYSGASRIFQGVTLVNVMVIWLETFDFQ